MNPYAQHAAGLFEPFASLRCHRERVWEMAWREVVGHSRGSVIGIAWPFSNPVFVLLVCACVFSLVFKAHRGFGAGDGRSGFAILLFVGTIVYGQFDEVANRAPGKDQAILAGASRSRKG